MGTFPALRAGSLKQRTPMELLQDNYIFGGIDSGKWITWGTLSVNATTNLDLEIVSANGYTDYGGTLSKRAYDLTSSYAFQQLLDAGSQVDGLEVYPVELSVGSNALSIMVYFGNVYARQKINGSYGTVGSSVAYNSTTMKWFRIRETDGTIYWEYAADPTSTWTTIATQATKACPFPITALIGGSTLGTWGTPPPVTTAKFGNFNVLPNQYQFSWKGLTWNKRIHIGDPASNTPMSVENISLPDANNYLTFTLSNPNLNNPVGAEIFSDQRGFGYGTYIVVIGTELDTMDHRAGWGGLFTFDFTAPPDYKEIDVDETRDYGGNANIQLLHTNVWNNGGVRAFDVHNADVNAAPVQTHRLIWTAGQIKIDTFAGVGVGGTLLFSTTITTNVPTPGLERIHFNIWNNTAVANYQQVPTTQVVVQDFSFTPPGTNYTQTLTDTITPAETFLRSTTKLFTETVSPVEIFIRSTTKTLIETLSLSEVFATLKTQFRTFTDSVSLSEVFTRSTTKIFTETISPTETFIKGTTKLFIESLSLIETFIKQPQKLFSDSVTPTDTMTYLKAQFRTFTDTITLSEVFIRNTTKAFVESLSLIETIKKLVQRTFTESVSLNEVFIKSLQKTFIESISLIEVFIKNPQKVFIESITLSEVFTTLKAYFKTLTDSVSPSDSITKLTNKAFIETVSLVETITRFITKLFTETVSPAETFTVLKAFFKTFTDSVTISDSITKLTTKVLTETLSLVEVFVRATTKVLKETLSLTETFVTLKVLLRTMTDSITLSDSMTKLTAKAVSESVSILETINKFISKGIIDTVSPSDTIGRLVKKSFVETPLSLIEAFSKVIVTISHTLLFTDSIVLTETFTKAVSKRFIDTISLLESFRRTVTGEWLKIQKAIAIWTKINKPPV